MFEDLELNITEPKGDSLIKPPPTFPVLCQPTMVRFCSETSSRYCC